MRGVRHLLDVNNRAMDVYSICLVSEFQYKLYITSKLLYTMFLFNIIYILCWKESIVLKLSILTF